MQENVMVSFMNPDPQKITLGIKRKAIAICFVNRGYNFVNTTNIFHIPMNDNAVKMTDVGR